MSAGDIFESLASDYPLLYLDPDTDTRETYRRVVLRGEKPEKERLDRYRGSVHDRDETADTPAGPVRVITLGDRRDFELVLRGFTAAKTGPLTPVPKSQGAAALTVFNWKRINAHLSRFPQEERAAEFRRFTSVKENYTDMLVVLSRGPYSGVGAEEVGLSEEEWLDRSDTIRRFHELTHVICRRLYPDDIDAIRDELIADAVGLYAAFGRFEPETEKLFLGFRGGRYVGGRLENYTDEPEKHAGLIFEELDRIGRIVGAAPAAEPFGLIPALFEPPGPTDAGTPPKRGVRDPGGTYDRDTTAKEGE
ncbi:MAG: hypothetical protein K5855_00380 [Oscillospiraceae bacterium]|nr:hypothetical protein [Oscillospiraceae bacterium]